MEGRKSGARAGGAAEARLSNVPLRPGPSSSFAIQTTWSILAGSGE